MLDLLREPEVQSPCPPDSGEPLAVCVVTETFPPEINGVTLTLGHLVKGLRARGHQVAVVRPRQPGVDPAGAHPDPDVTLARGLAMPGYPAVRFGLPAGRALRRRWDGQPPDAVYVATEGPLGWSALQAARRLGLPVLAGFHTNFHRYARHYHIGWTEPVVEWYLRGFHNRATGTVVATADLRDRLHERGFRAVSVLGRGVDGRLFNPARRSASLRRSWGVTDDDLVALCVGRVAAEKNVGLAIEAYRVMRDEHPRCRLVIVGDGPLRRTLERAHPELFFTGMLTGETLAAHFASADLFLFPSETETFGNVTLEALASGLALVAYDYAAAREHVRPGRTGLLVPHGDAGAFVAAAAALARAPERVREMRRAISESVRHLEWDGVVGRFERLLRDVARPGPGLRRPGARAGSRR
ncbi:MAG TPA: glycosyltransferase family 1 protein [Methylomirabilota bacterium]|jgi:glycosyltransferase involved in cell wall biosynthesis